jgi:hypothetical protein
MARNTPGDHRAKTACVVTTSTGPAHQSPACTVHEISSQGRPDRVAGHTDHGQEEHPNGGHDSLQPTRPHLALHKPILPKSSQTRGYRPVQTIVDGRPKIETGARKNPLTWAFIQIERASSDRRDDRI